MKRKVKMIITAFAVCAVSAMAVMFTGCSMIDKIKEKIEQARCEHEWNDGEVTKESTCFEVGELTKTCSLCGKEEYEELPLISHIETVSLKQLPTCTEKGISEGVRCEVCNTVISGCFELEELGHVLVRDMALKPTCETVGLTYGEHCGMCDEVFIKQEEIEPLGHTLFSFEEKYATCTEDGYSQKIECSTCKKVFTDLTIYPALGHDFDENGRCTRCNEFIDSESKMAYYSENAVERNIEIGESVAGKVLRFYRLDGLSASGVLLTDFGELVIGAAGKNCIGTNDSIFWSKGNPVDGDEAFVTVRRTEEYVDILFPIRGYLDVYMNGEWSNFYLHAGVVIEGFYNTALNPKVVELILIEH